MNGMPQDKTSQAVCYAYRYPDLLNHFGCDVEGLEDHFSRAGEGEGRLYGCELDLVEASSSQEAICYANSYADLKAAYGYDFRQLETHFQVYLSILIFGFSCPICTSAIAFRRTTVVEHDMNMTQGCVGLLV